MNLDSFSSYHKYCLPAKFNLSLPIILHETWKYRIMTTNCLVGLVSLKFMRRSRHGCHVSVQCRVVVCRSLFWSFDSRRLGRARYVCIVFWNCGWGHVNRMASTVFFEVLNNAINTPERNVTCQDVISPFDRLPSMDKFRHNSDVVEIFASIMYPCCIHQLLPRTSLNFLFQCNLCQNYTCIVL